MLKSSPRDVTIIIFIILICVIRVAPCKLDGTLDPTSYSLYSLGCGGPVAAGETKQVLLDQQHFPT